MNTRKQPLTINGGNINKLRQNIYNMFAELVPSKEYRYYMNGNVMMNSLPFYQCGGTNSIGRTFIIKNNRTPTKDEATAFEILAHSFKDEGVTLKKRHGKVTGLRLMFKPRNTPKHIETKPNTSYNTSDNKNINEEVDDMFKFDATKMFVVVSKDNFSHMVLSRKEIEKNVEENEKFLESVNIYNVGSKLQPKVKMILSLT